MVDESGVVATVYGGLMRLEISHWKGMKRKGISEECL